MNSDTLIITRDFYPNFGGVASFITEFIKCYTKKRPNSCVYIVCPTKTSLPDFIKESNVSMFTPKFNLTFISLDAGGRKFLLIIQTLLYYCFILVQSGKLLLCRGNTISFTYGVGGPFAILASIILSKIFKKICFGHIHIDFQFVKGNILSRLFYKSLFNRLNKVFVNSKDVEMDLLKIGVTNEKIVIVNNWVDTRIFKIKNKKTCRKLLNLPVDKKILLFVGRLSNEKGIFEVLNCIDFFKNNREFLFVIIGFPSKNLIEKRLKSYKNTFFLGSKRNFELVNYYNAADVLLWGSVDTHYVSITIMEALHCGLPVIAPITTTNINKIGIKKFYVKQDTLPTTVGMLFGGNAKSLTKAIGDFFGKKFNREKINKYALEKYSEKNVNLILSKFRWD